LRFPAFAKAMAGRRAPEQKARDEF